MKNAIILHGAGNNSQGNWFPWLKINLEKKGYAVWVPDLPNSDVPDQNLWLARIKQNPNGEINNQTVLIGHSSGATLILRILENLPPTIKVKKVVLVATPIEIGTKDEYFQYKRGLLNTPFDWKKIKNSAQHFYFFHSDNDQYECGISQGNVLKKQLDGTLLIREGEGHFNLETGQKYRQFPEVLELIDEDRS